MVKRDYVKVTFRLLLAEHGSIMDAAKFLYEQGALPRPTAGTYARAAALLMYKGCKVSKGSTGSFFSVNSKLIKASLRIDGIL